MKFQEFPVVAQWVKILIQCPRGCRFDPGFIQQAKDKVLPQAAVQVTDMAQIRHCRGCGIGQQLQLLVYPQPGGTSTCHKCGCKKIKNIKKKFQDIQLLNSYLTSAIPQQSVSDFLTYHPLILFQFSKKMYTNNKIGFYFTKSLFFFCPINLHLI